MAKDQSNAEPYTNLLVPRNTLKNNRVNLSVTLNVKSCLLRFVVLGVLQRNNQKNVTISRYDMYRVTQ